jgi:mRNA-degrading endonuclease RelE of RelBE toxin-antitoxin system
VKSSVGLDEEAETNLRKLSPHTKKQATKVLKRLPRDPHRRQDREHADAEDMWRARAGRRWRIISTVTLGQHIQVKRIRQRADAYKGIEHPDPQDVREPEVVYQAEEISVSAAATD